jgi:hypothetical protein
MRRSEAVTAVGMNSSIFWDIMPCLLHAGLLLDLFFNLEDGGDKFSTMWVNVSVFCTTLHTRK